MKRKPAVRSLLKLKPFIAWLKKQPAHRSYDYQDNYNCPFCQFLKAHGYQGVSAGGYYVTADDKTYDLPNGLGQLPTPNAGEMTFGALLTRAKRAARR